MQGKMHGNITTNYWLRYGLQPSNLQQNFQTISYASPQTINWYRKPSLNSRGECLCYWLYQCILQEWKEWKSIDWAWSMSIDGGYSNALSSQTNKFFTRNQPKDPLSQ